MALQIGLLLFLLFPSSLQADILPPEQHDHIHIYNTSVELPDEGNPWHILRATVGNSSQYNLKQIKLELALCRGDDTLHIQELVVYWDVPVGETKDCSKNFVLNYKIDNEKEHIVRLRILSIKGDRKK